MRESFLPSRGIAYRISDLLPQRPTLVLVHGLSGSLSAWAPFEPRFTPHYNVVEYDLRGHGLSRRPRRASGYSMHEHVEDLRAVLEALGIERCVLVAHSLGTLIAMKFAITHPERVERAVMIAPAYGVYRFGLTRALVRILSALAFLPLRLRAYGRTDYSRFPDTQDYSVRRIATDLLHMGLRSYLHCMRTIFSRNYDADWKALTMPVLLIHGTRDAIVPYAHAEALRDALPNAQLETINGNHILVVNNVKEVADRLEKFVAQ